MKRLWPWLCALLSGILLTLCFAPANLGSLAWVALTPLVAALWFSESWARRDGLRLALLGYVTGLGYFVGSLHWLVTVTLPGWLVLAAYLAIYPAVWAWFVGTVAKPRQSPFESRPVWMKSWNNLAVAALAAAVWTALEWLRGIVFTGFGWNSLGVALHENVAMIQITDITGVGGLSFLLVMVNVIAVVTVRRLMVEIGRHKLRPHYDFSLTVALVAVVFAYGVRQIFSRPPAGQDLTFAVVQANVPILEKRDPARDEQILETHIKQSEAAIALRPDLLVWPEAATPRPLFSDQRSWNVVRSLAEKHDGDFMLGTVHFERDRPPLGDFNSAVLLTGHGQKAQLYHKMHLVPFGEYVPLRESFPLFAWIVGDLVADDFDFGRDATVFEMAAKPIKIGPLICFEDTLGNLARQFALRGAQVFVTVTNDAWFLTSAGSRQHLAHAVFRCAETKLPMVRAANTGVSCAIDRFGRVQQIFQNAAGNTFIEGFLSGRVTVASRPEITLYTRNGEAFSLICLAISVAAVGIGLFRPSA